MKCKSCGSKNVREAKYSEDGEEHDCIVCNDCGWWG